MTKRESNEYCDWVARLAGEGPRLEVELVFDGLVDESWLIRDRVLDHFHAINIRAGRGLYTVDGESVDLYPGKVLFVGPGTCYSTRGLDIDPAVPFRIQPIRFRVKSSDRKCTLPWGSRTFWFEWEFSQASVWIEAMARVYELHEGKAGRFSDMQKSNLIWSALAHLASEVEQFDSERSRVDPRLDRAKQFIRETAGERPSLEQMAKIAGMHPRYFSRRFKQTYGLGPKAYAVEHRLSLARGYLLETDMRVSEVALLLGYSDPFLFSRQYTDHFSEMPSRARDGRM